MSAWASRFFDYFCNMTDRPDCDIPHGQNSSMTQSLNCDKGHRMDVAIATWQPEGIRRVEAMNLPYVPGVRYVVSWQLPGPDPVIPKSLADRDDVSVFIIEKAGVSVNRNNACTHCTADIILNSDDDLIYNADQLQAIIDTFDRNPDVDLAAFQYNGAQKQYPPKECDLTSNLPKGYYGSLIEIAVRRKVFRKVTFDVNFGPVLRCSNAARIQNSFMTQSGPVSTAVSSPSPSARTTIPPPATNLCQKALPWPKGN